MSTKIITLPRVGAHAPLGNATGRLVHPKHAASQPKLERARIALVSNLYIEAPAAGETP